jgi:hypothetical protein
MFPNARELFESVLTDGLDELLMQRCYIQDNIRHCDIASAQEIFKMLNTSGPFFSADACIPSRIAKTKNPSQYAQ